MTETEKKLLQDYKKMLNWLISCEDMQEIEKNTFADSRLIANETIRNKFFKIEREVNEFYEKSDENKIELEKIWEGLNKVE